MATFVITNLNGIENFNFENIKFERLTDDIKNGKQWREKLNATFKAVADDNLDIKPIISKNGLIGVVNDICLLLSLALSSYVYCSKCILKEPIISEKVLRFSDVRGKRMVRHGNIELFLDTAASTLRKPEWAKKTGFVPSIYFLRGANCSEFDDVAFMLSWIALEVLTNAYASEQGISTILSEDEFKEIVKPAIIRALSEIGKENLTEKQKALIEGKVSELNRPSIRNKVRKLRDEYGWDFITDRLFNDCNELRNQIIHSGTYGGFNQHKLINLSTRFRDSIQLALIELLGCINCVPDLQNLKIKIKDDKTEK